MKRLTEQELFELNEALKELSPSLFGFGDYKVTASQENNKLIITIEEKDYQVDFENYLKTLDDDIFLEACARYQRITGNDLHKIKNVTPELISTFKKMVTTIAREKIEDIRKRYKL